MAKQIVIADSTQLSAYGQCPEMFNLGYKERLTHSNVIDEDIAAGSYGHKLLEIYYKNKQCGGVPYALQKCSEFHLNENFPLSKEDRATVADRFKFYWMRYSQQDYTTLTHAVRVIKVKNGLPCEVIEQQPMVEQGFSYLLLDSKEYLFVLEGRIDWIASTFGMNLWVDHKFQFRKRDLYVRDIQFKNYSLATGLNTGVINYIRLHKKVEEDTLKRQSVSFSPVEMKWWKEELIEMFIEIAKSAKQGYKKRWTSCKGLFGYPCQYVDLCNERHPITIEAIKRTQYVKKEEWKPW